MKSLLLGLLIVGTAPVASQAIANSWIVSANSTSLSVENDLCNISDSVNNSCNPPTLSENVMPNFNFYGNIFSGDSRDDNSSLWLQQIANLLLPGWSLQRCWHQSSVVKSNDSVCLSPWSRIINPNNLSQTNLVSSNFVTSDDEKSNQLKVKKLKFQSSQFPSLSRSSLIVSSPTNKLLPCPDLSTPNHNCYTNAKLANPAPETERIASSFGWRRRPYSGRLQFHQGIDYGAPLGSPVVAVGNGIVTKVISGCRDFGSRWCGNQFGNWIEIDHGNGKVGIYGHLLNQSITVKEGTKVWRNQEIAKVGSSGWSTGAHLDFRLKIDDEYQNPADYVSDINRKASNK